MLNYLNTMVLWMRTYGNRQMCGGIIYHTNGGELKDGYYSIHT